MKQTTQRIPELDGLRGVAILLVISFHYINNQLTNATTALSRAFYMSTSFGWIGVDLFFVLSGFLITTILLVNRSSANYFSTFFTRRVVRIIPNYYLLLVVFLLVGVIPYFQDNYFLTGNKAFPDWTYFVMVQNFYMAASHNMGNNALSVTWSIAIEEQFYLLFPVIIYYSRDKWLPWIFILLMIGAYIGRMQFDHWIPAYVLLHCRADALAMGALIAWLNLRVDLKQLVSKYYFYLLLVPVVVIGISAFLFIRYQDLGVVRNTLFSVFFGFCLLMALTRNSSWYAGFLRNKILMWVGTLSYSVYLFHYLILGIFNHFAGKRGGIGIDSTGDVLNSVAALCTTFLFAWLVYKFLEAPMVTIGKRFKY